MSPRRVAASRPRRIVRTAQRHTSPGASRIIRSTLTTQLEEALRTDIVAGLLEPGQKLRAGDITTLYGVSATPIREALQRLSAEGLVELDPKIGAKVAPISLDDVRDVFAVQLILEPRALELSVRRCDEHWLHEVETALERLRTVSAAKRPKDDPRWREAMLASADAHRSLHWALLAACGSPWLLRFISILHGHTARYRMLLIRGRDRPDWLRDHEQIVEAARRRDPRRAVQILERHTHHGLDMLVRAYGSSSHAARGRRSASK